MLLQTPLAFYGFLKYGPWDFGGNGNTPIPWGTCYCVVIVLLLSCCVVVIVLLLSCYLVVIVLLLCCYCRASLLLLSCYCAVLLLLLVFVVLLYPSRCIAGHCVLHLHLVVFVSYQLAHKRGWILRTSSCSAFFARSTANGRCIAHA